MTQETNNEASQGADQGSGDLFNTAAGWVLFAAGLGLGLSILADKYFHGYDPERPEQLGYVIEGVEEDAGAAKEISFAEALASVTVEDGEKVFAKCSACHGIDQGGADGVGPNLYGVMGANIGSHAPGYAYSSAMASFGGQWGWDEMNEWLANPRGYIDGTKMGFAGLSSIEDRAAVSLYMNANGSSLAVPEFTPAEEPAAEEPAADDAAAEGAEEATEAAPAEGEATE
jgi:cytochrome c